MEVQRSLSLAGNAAHQELYALQSGGSVGVLVRFNLGKSLEGSLGLLQQELEYPTLPEDRQL